MPDRTAYFEDLRARGEPIPQMHPDDFAEKIFSIMRRLEEFGISATPIQLPNDLPVDDEQADIDLSLGGTKIAQARDGI